MLVCCQWYCSITQSGWNYQILHRHLKSTARRLKLGQVWVFQQDNNPQHTLEVVFHWIKQANIKLVFQLKGFVWQHLLDWPTFRTTGKPKELSEDLRRPAVLVFVPVYFAFATSISHVKSWQISKVFLSLVIITLGHSIPNHCVLSASLKSADTYKDWCEILASHEKRFVNSLACFCFGFLLGFFFLHFKIWGHVWTHKIVVWKSGPGCIIWDRYIKKKALS